MKEAINIQLQPVTRDNWLQVIDLNVHEEQRGFVPSVAVSICKVYVKPDGDQVEYLPFAIYDGEMLVGFMMHAFEEDTHNMYWINGFLVDAKYQGRGYGKAALLHMIDYIKNRFPQCEEIRLTVHHENATAERLYKSIGFLETGVDWGEEKVLRLLVERC